MTRAKVLIDQAAMSFADLADIEDELGVSLASLFEKSQARGMAALVWVTVRRTDPTFTFEQALQYGPGDIENVEESAPEVSGAAGGAKPQNSLVSGLSTLAT